MKLLKLKCLLSRTGIGNMDCGKDTQTYILTMTWFTPLALAIIEKISSSLRLPGSLLLKYYMLYIRRKNYESVVSFYLYVSFQCKDLFRVITLKFCFIIRRKTNNNTYNGSTWQIRFKLDNVDTNDTTYKLRIALATAHVSELQVFLFTSTNYLLTLLNTYVDNLNVIFHIYLDALLEKSSHAKQIASIS